MLFRPTTYELLRSVAELIPPHYCCQYRFNKIKQNAEPDNCNRSLLLRIFNDNAERCLKHMFHKSDKVFLF
jgi:hypothetical protein